MGCVVMYSRKAGRRKGIYNNKITPRKEGKILTKKKHRAIYIRSLISVCFLLGMLIYMYYKGGWHPFSQPLYNNLARKPESYYQRGISYTWGIREPNAISHIYIAR